MDINITMFKTEHSQSLNCDGDLKCITETLNFRVILVFPSVNSKHAEFKTCMKETGSVFSPLGLHGFPHLCKQLS